MQSHWAGEVPLYFTYVKINISVNESLAMRSYSLPFGNSPRLSYAVPPLACHTVKTLR